MSQASRDATIILASASPRRRETLERLGFPFVASPADVDESLADHLPIAQRVVALAGIKARATPTCGPLGRWVLGADTLVALDGKAFGKPADEAEARAMIAALAGRDHVVATGLALLDLDSGSMRTGLSETLVRFSPMSEAETDSYLASGEWRGAAGAYRIQDRAAFFVERVEGSYSGVVGLPIREFYVILAQSAYPLAGLGAREP